MKSLVITSIADDRNQVLNLYAMHCRKKDFKFIIIGDKKSPSTFNLPGADFWSLERQHKSSFKRISKLLPVGHYSRKNIGYLVSISEGSDVIVETDDDNIPYDKFWKIPEKNLKVLTVTGGNWTNVYRYFSNKIIWPRGFSLSAIQSGFPKNLIRKNICCPIQQGLANDNPDVDAIFRLICSEKIKFLTKSPVALGKNSWCPFNSQNTVWHRDAFPLLYLPSFCSFRMTDIWRSFIAQRIAWENNWHILFYSPTVYQKRNVHDLMKDFSDEIPGYMENDKIRALLSDLTLKGGIDNMHDDLIHSYEAMIKKGLLPNEELPLLKEWIQNLQHLSL